MHINDITKIIEGEIICGPAEHNQSVDKAFACDLMSDVLTLDIENLLLITGLNNVQTIRTAEVAEIKHVLLVRNKKPTADMIRLAEKENISLMVTKKTLFEISGILYNAGLKPVF